MYETGGKLRPAVEAYLTGRELSKEEIALIRDYFRQWFGAPVWAPSAKLNQLIARVELISTRLDIERCIDDALELGIDPL